MNASVTLNVMRAVRVFLLLALAGFVQPQQASAQSLLGTWKFDLYDNATGDLVYSKTVVIDKKAKSFRISNDTELTALKINPSKGTFEGAIFEGSKNLGWSGYILGGIAETDQGLIIGETERVQLVSNPFGQRGYRVLERGTFIGVRED